MFGDRVEKLWDKLPAFMKDHMTVRTTLRGSSDEFPAEPWKHEPIEKANLITSKVERYPYGIEYHRPVLDIDFEAELIPSSTPGHYHLYLDKMIPKESYFQLLNHLARVGIIQHGFADASIDRGASSARLPWIKKDDWAANQGDPGLARRELANKLAEHQREAERLRLQLAELDTIVAF